MQIKRPIFLFLLMVLVLAACGDDVKLSDPEKDTPTPAPGAYRSELFGVVPETETIIADFTLESTTGTPFTLSEQSGKITVIYFGFTACPDVCPLTFTELRKAYQTLGSPQDKLNILMITIDPERDSLDILGNYLGIYNADFIGLRGEGDTLEAVKKAFGVVAAKVELEDSALGYTMDHTANVFILGPDGELIAQFAHGATGSNFAHDLQLILDNEL